MLTRCAAKRYPENFPASEFLMNLGADFLETFIWAFAPSARATIFRKTRLARRDEKKAENGDREVLHRSVWLEPPICD